MSGQTAALASLGRLTARFTFHKVKAELCLFLLVTAKAGNDTGHAPSGTFRLYKSRR